MRIFIAACAVAGALDNRLWFVAVYFLASKFSDLIEANTKAKKRYWATFENL